MRDISKKLKEYFNLNFTILLSNKKNTRKPIRLTILTDSIKEFYEKIGLEGAKQKTLKGLIS